MVASSGNGAKLVKNVENWKPTSKILVLAEPLVKEMRKMCENWSLSFGYKG